MSILYSIPIHECSECVKQMGDGILFFDTNAVIVLHISDTQHIDFYKTNNHRILINLKQFETKWGWDLSRVHVSNYLYAKSKFEISDIIFLTSNCLMLRNPSEYIKDYDCGFSEYKHDASKLTPPLLVEDYQIGWAGDLPKSKEYQSILSELNTDKLYGCVIDGGYVKSKVMDRIVYLYEKYYNYKTLGFSLEEQLFPTIACNISGKISDALLHMGDQQLEGFKILLQTENVFFNKRIPRNMNNELRNYYNTIINQ